MFWNKNLYDKSNARYPGLDIEELGGCNSYSEWNNSNELARPFRVGRSEMHLSALEGWMEI